MHVLKIFIENYTADQILENADLLEMVYATFGDLRLGHCIHWRAWEFANINRFDNLQNLSKSNHKNPFRQPYYF